MPQSQAQKDWAKRKKEEAKEHLRTVKARPCADCGVEYPYYVMQLDHIGDDKVNSVSVMIANRQYKAAIAEMDKCEVVCANCHAIRTWTRMGM